MGAKEFASTTLFESLPPMQFAKVLTIVVLVVAATVAQQEVPDAEFEMAPAWGDSEDISLMESPAQANKRILKNIRDVIAFAQGAKEKAFDMTEGHVKVKIHTSPIVRIVLDLAKKSKMKNIVLRYVHDMERAQADFPMGIGHYVLNHLHRAIIKGKGAVRIRKEGDHYYAKLTHRALGLQALPAYVDTLKVLQHKYITLVHSISIKGVAHAVSASCLAKNRLRSYRKFYKDFRSGAKTAISKEHRKLAKGAFKHIVKAKHVVAKPPSGIKGAKVTLKKDGGVYVMSGAAMKKKAKQLARQWAKANGHCGKLSEYLSGNTGMAAAKVVTHNKKKAKKLAKKYSKPAKKAQKLFALAQAAAKAKKAAAAKAAAQKNIRENARKVARSKKIAALKRKAAAAKAKHAKEQKAKADKALAKARAIRDKKERAHKNRVVRKCTTTDKWANCTAHPLSWYTNCKGAGTSRPTWRRCGFLNAGGQYLCRRVTCRNVRVRI